ncbi:MAG: ATP-binding protein [Kofleriaceae bacterium]
MGQADPDRVAFETARLELARLRVSEDADQLAPLRHGLRLCARTVKVERVGFWQFTAARAALQLTLGYTASTDEWHGGEVLVSRRHQAYWDAIAGRRILAAHDARTDPMTCELTDHYLVPLGITSMLDAPVFRAGELIGVICFEHVGPARTWSADELSFASASADLVAMVLEQGDRLAAEAALRVRTGKLVVADKLDVLESLCRGLAHDFANVLLAVNLVSARLAKRGDAELATSLRSCAEVGGNLVGQLRRFGSRAAPVPERLPVRQVLERLVPIIVTLVRDEAAVVVELTELPPDVVATMTAAHLEQVVLNLCLNAKDAITAPGTIQVVAAADERAVTVQVRDDGAGIPADILERIWEPLYTTKAHGTGLGLATVRAIVADAGATIAVDTAVGHGTTFTITLPRG